VRNGRKIRVARVGGVAPMGPGPRGASVWRYSSRPISGFVTGDLGAGHLVAVVDDQEASLRFYRDLLGLRISDYILREMGGRATRTAFLHANGRHHSIAFSNTGRPAGAKRLNHFMLQVKSLNDVGETYDLVHARGIPLRTTLGRHTNDHMVSFYMISPSGFGVEYGWGAREVDDTTWQVQTHRSGNIWGHQQVAAAREARELAGARA